MRKYKGAGIALLKKQNNDYAILLGKRTIKQNKGKWSIPGGKFEKNDNFFFETAIREFREETGINIFDIVIKKKLLYVDLIISLCSTPPPDCLKTTFLVVFSSSNPIFSVVFCLSHQI